MYPWSTNDYAAQLPRVAQTLTHQIPNNAAHPSTSDNTSEQLGQLGSSGANELGEGCREWLYELIEASEECNSGGETSTSNPQSSCSGYCAGAGAINNARD